MLNLRRFTFFAALMVATTGVLARSVNFYVSSDGGAVARGTRLDPFATLVAARAAVRRLKNRSGLPSGGVTVWVRGEFHLAESFQLGPEDGGEPDKPVVYRSWGRKPVRLSGGQQLPANAFSPTASDRLPKEAVGNVLVADLASLGITNTGGFPTVFRGYAAVSELFVNDTRMQLARWPNEGWAATPLNKIIRKGSRPRNGDKTNIPGIIEYTGDRPSRWTQAKDMRLHGYWCYDWYDEALPIGSIDLKTRQITFATPHYYGVGGGNPPPRRWRAINLLEELDIPGEFFIDREAGKLYLWPPGPLAGARVVLSVLQTPIIQVTGASHLAIRGFTLENCVKTAIKVLDGESVRIEACLVRNVGESAIDVNGGKGHRVAACDVHDTGARGITIAGGDRRQLIPAGHVAENNHVWRFSRRQQTYAGAIHVQGVGNTVRHNLLHDAPHTAIFLGGNDHVVEYNTVHHVCMETDDCGAFYKGRNPSSRGNTIRYNFWHHVGSPRGHGNNAVYFDDGDGGDTVFGNVFFRCGEPANGTMAAVFSHGGHDLDIHNNVFVECKRAIGASPWSDGRWKGMLKGATYQTRLLKEVDITKPPYTTRYPKLVGYMDYTNAPRRHRAERNVVVMSGQFYCGNYDVADSFVTDSDPGFEDIDEGDFALRNDAIVFEEIPDFQPIPFAKIGLVKSALRPDPIREAWDYEPPKQLPAITRHAPKAPKAAIKPPETAGKPPKTERKPSRRGKWLSAITRRAPEPPKAVKPPKAARKPSRRGRWLSAITRRAPEPPEAAGKPPKAAPKPLEGGKPPVIKPASCQISCPPAEILAKGTWPVPTILITQDVQGHDAKPTSQARVMCFGGVLRIVVENDVPAGSNLKNNAWGGDAIEIALLRAKPKQGEPIAVLRGYPTGKFEVGTAKDAAAAPVWRQDSSVAYAAKVVAPTFWRCVWAIPLADLGYDPAKDKLFSFNISVRKAKTNLWQMLWGTNGHSYDAPKAATLQLP
jgi:hypothetical protein